jgi:hypothetical protein
MEFPINLTKDALPLWSLWVANIGAIVIIITTIAIAIFGDPISFDANISGVGFSLVIGVVGFLIALIWLVAWYFIAAVALVLLTFAGLRLLADWTRNKLFYYRYER